jgi:hypothetical protein
MSGIWLPCGIYNFRRVARTQIVSPYLAGEDSLLERVRSLPTFTNVNEHEVPARNFAFCSARRDGVDIYLDSDGFIACRGDLETLVQVIGGSTFFVPRAVDSAAASRDHSSVEPVHSGGEAELEPGGDSSSDALDECILTSFQLNCLLEGVCNSAFDPRVFFTADSEDEWTQRIERSRFRLDELLRSLAISDSYPDSGGMVPMSLRLDCFKRSLRVLRNEHLLPLKWNIESVRRTLLADSMHDLHRNERLQQLVIRRKSAPVTADGTERDDRRRDALVEKASEQQLRGYVMLISAKLPLIENISRLMDDVAAAVNEWSSSGSRARHKSDRESMAQILRSWNGLEAAVADNIRALERSFEAVWRDRLLHENEQMRAEEEALAELQREAAGAATGRWFDTLLFVGTLALTAVAVYFATGSGSGGGAVQIEIAIAITVVVVGCLYGLSHWARHYYGSFSPQYETVVRIDRRLHGQVVLHTSLDDDDALRQSVHPATEEPAQGSLRRSQGRWIEVPVGPDDSKLFVRRQLERRNLRTESPSPSDSYARVHFNIDCLLVNPTARPGQIILRHIPHEVILRLELWICRRALTLPKGRLSIQCVAEYHRHLPSPQSQEIVLLREVRLVIMGRQRTTARVNLLLLELVAYVTPGCRADAESSLSDRLSLVAPGDYTADLSIAIGGDNAGQGNTSADSSEPVT